MNRNEQQVAAKIRAGYLEKQQTDLDALRELDRKVKNPINIFSYIFGIISAIIMGAGMSLVMTDIAEKIGLGADSMTLGIVLGVIGMIMTLANYPIYKSAMKNRREKYAPEIVALSDKIINK